MNCHNLDDYLCGLLDEHSEAKFKDHLAECGDCSQAVQADRQLMSTLRLASNSLETPSDPLSQLAQSLSTETKKRGDSKLASRSMAVVFAACCLLLIAFGLAVFKGSPPERMVMDSENGGTNKVDDSRTGTVVNRPSIAVVSNHVGVEVESSDPNITIMMLYPKKQVALNELTN